ncbi:MAG: hypothetical protein KDK55_03795 [Chlamydiia bacterium]|nr:hypothetical protein [Chlamydiia bacterium]
MTDFFNEIIGLLIVLFAILFPVIRRILIERKKRKYPEQYKKEQEEAERLYQEMLDSMQIEKKVVQTKDAFSSKEPPPISHRLVRPEYEFHSEIEGKRRLSEIETRALETQKAPQFKETVVSPAFVPFTPTGNRRRKKHLQALIGKGDVRKLVIYSEIFGKPNPHLSRLFETN